MKKTIFFSLSSPNVFRNLFFFSGSVFDKLKIRLKNDPQLKIVFLLSPRYHQEYFSAIFEPFVNDRFLVEVVSVSRPSGIVEKVFHFFYSYFIYTGTTKTLATMGMRLDEPPAGGLLRHYLFPLKILISKTFGRSTWIKVKALPYVYSLIFRERTFRDVFNKYKPDLVFAPHIFGRFDTELLAEANRRKVRTMGMISNWDHFDKYYLPFKVDKLLAQSDQIKDFAIHYQDYKENRVVTVGYPYFDFILDKKYIISREELLKKLNFPVDAKYVLYISGSAYCPDEPDIIDAILKWADRGKFGVDCRLALRPYNGGRGKDKDFDSKKFDSFEIHPRVFTYRKDFWGDVDKSKFFINIVRHADVVISVYTTAVLEAAVLDRPLVMIGFDGYQKRPFSRSIKRFQLREHFQDVLKSGGVRIANNFEELFLILDNYFKNPELDVVGREGLRDRTCYKLDSHSSERVFNLLLS